MRALRMSTMFVLCIAGGCGELLFGSAGERYLRDDAGGTAGTGGASESSVASSSGGSGQASTSSSTGGGGGPECTTANDCPATANECITVDCVQGDCVEANVAANTPTSVQTVGDCKASVCDGNGNIIALIEDSDISDDGKECTVDTCSNGAISNVPKPAETPCATGYCDLVGICTQCVASANCNGDFSCFMGLCFDCNDGTMNGTESDIDCGSDCLTKCADGKNCTVNWDCFYGTCDNNICVSCFDGMRNSTESDIDCGGVCGATCIVNKKCNSGADCVAGVCNAGTKTCAAPTCTDMVKNGTETDIDCGGACPKCGPGKHCKVNADCVGGTTCVMGTCA